MTEPKTGYYLLYADRDKWPDAIGELHTDGRVVLYAGWWNHPGDVVSSDTPGADVALTIRSNGWCAPEFVTVGKDSDAS